MPRDRRVTLPEVRLRPGRHPLPALQCRRGSGVLGGVRELRARAALTVHADHKSCEWLPGGEYGVLLAVRGVNTNQIAREAV